MRWERLALATILAVYLALGVMYSLVTPVFEAPDESFHFYVIKHIVDHRALPVQSETTRGHWQQEGSQPPLYYLIGAGLVGWIDLSDAESLLWANPQANIGDPANPGNKNVYIHPPAQDFPWRGAVLAVHVLRFFSLALGAATVGLIWAIVRLVFPAARMLALTVAAVAAFIPQFLFITASVNNDNLMTCLGTLSVYLLLKELKGASSGLRVKSYDVPRLTPHVSYLILGLVLGLACLTKLSALALLGLAGVVIVLVAWHRRSWHVFWARVLWAGVPVLAVAGWWYVRNLVLYGEPTGLSAMWQVVGRRTDFGRDLWGEFRGLRWSFWGLFGWFSVAMPAWIYRLFDVLSVLAVAGLLVEVGRWLNLGLWRGAWASLRYREPEWGAAYRPLSLILLGLWLGIVLAALVRWTSLTEGAQGRLLFPALGSFALFWMLGLRAWFLPRVRDAAGVALACLLFIFAAVAPWAWIAPAYARPTLMDTLPRGAIVQDRVWGEGITLRGVSFEQVQVRPGEAFRVNLFWQLDRPVGEPEQVMLWLRLIDEHGQFVGVEDAYPGAGGFPVSLWPVGPLVAERQYVWVGEDVDAPLIARLDLSLYRERDGVRLSEPQTIGRVKVVPRRWPPMPRGAMARFDLGAPGSIRLAGGELPRSVRRGDILPVTLTWTVYSPPGRDVHAFVHLINAAGEVVGYGDGAPREGRYPTRYWAASEVVRDVHRVTVPPELATGTYRLKVGLYDEGGRIPAYRQNGERWAEDAVVLDAVEVE